MTKQTDDLIQILAQMPTPRKPLPFGLVLMALTLASLGITFTVLGKLRPEFYTFDLPVSFYIKTALLLSFALIGISFLREAAKPLPAFPKLSLALLPPAILAMLVMAEWAGASSYDEILGNFHLVNFPSCLFFVSAYGLGGIAALTALMKQYAPADEKKAAALIGFAAATACAVGYSFHCPVDSPTFIVVAYGLPVATLALLARFIIPKFIRW